MPDAAGAGSAIDPSPEATGDRLDPSTGRPFFHYNCDADGLGAEDAGWGCVYRSFQSALSLTGVPESQIPCMDDMVSTLRKGVDPVEQRREMWIEPAEAATVPLRSGDGAAVALETAVFYNDDSALEHMQFTTPSQYSKRFVALKELWEYVRSATTAGGAVVIDNGTTGFCARIADEKLTLWDPHSVDPSRVIKVRDMEWLEACKLWMVLRVQPDKSE